MKIKILFFAFQISIFTLNAQQDTCFSLWKSCKEYGSYSAYIESNCKDSLAEAYLYRAIAAEKRHSIEKVEADYENAITIKPYYSEAYYHWAIFKFRNKQDTVALIKINKAIEINAGTMKYIKLRADILSGLNKFEEAIVDLKRIENTDNKTNQGDIKGAIGNNIINSGVQNDKIDDRKIKEGLVYLKEAYLLDSTNTKTLMVLGNAYFYLKQYEKSIFFYKKSLEIKPDNNDIKLNLAIAYRTLGWEKGQNHDIQKAIEYLILSFELNPKDFETARLLGVAYAFSGQVDNSIKWFKTSTEIEPNNAHAWWDLGTAYLQKHDGKKSKEYRDKAKQLDPNIEENFKKN